MGLFSVVKKSAGRIVGVDAIKAGGGIVGNLGKNVLARTCPKCAEGKMHVAGVDDGGKVSKMRVCSECGYSEPLTGPTEDELQELRAHAEDRFDALGQEDVADILRGHRNAFRMYLAVVILAFVYALYVIIFSETKGFVTSVAGFGLLCLALALKSSYRHWQVRTRTLFEVGSFQRWLKEGDWIV